ncbi:MAG: cyclic lactone autoinducer peptide [Eubacterium sp.]|nr:cyclic lactone autoinducer peptide [Eubacterium sp.]
MKMKNYLKKIVGAGVLNCLALMVVSMSANSACCWVYHQPEFPETANKFKKH